MEEFLVGKGRRLFACNCSSDSAGSFLESHPVGDDILRAIGTHHKTGTVLTYRVFRDISAKLGLSFFAGRQEDLPRGTEVWIEDHTEIDPSRLDRSLLGVHVIRHPHDIIASAYRYHLVCDEDWCIAPGYSNPDIVEMPEYRERFSDGRSYQEILNDLPQSEGVTLEIWRCRPNILYMAEWDYSQPQFLECKLEEFTADFDGTFRKILSHLELLDANHEVDVLRIAAGYDISRWSDKQLKDEPHVTNKTRTLCGRDLLQPDHYRLMDELFPKNLAAALGYSD